MKLILFDIDGTILTTPGAGRKAVEQALSDVARRAIATRGVTFSGKTDRQIIREVLRHNDLPERDVDALLDRAVEAYTEAMHALLQGHHITVFDGLPALLERLRQSDDVLLGLLTGNVEPIAYYKLQLAGLDHFFSFGAFGSDHEDRNALPAIALARAHALTPARFHGHDVVIIGDTEHDIRCSRVIGARAVAVCTGNYTHEDLSAHAPDCILQDLADLDAVLAALA